MIAPFNLANKGVIIDKQTNICKGQCASKMISLILQIRLSSTSSSAYNPDPGRGESPTRPGCLKEDPLVETPKGATILKKIC